MLGPLGRFPERRLIVGMNSLDEFFHSGHTIRWIKTQNAVAFLGPMPDVGVRTPCPTACVAESLRLREIGLAPPHRFFRPLIVPDVSHRPHELEGIRAIPQRVSGHVDVLYGTIRQ